MDVTVYVMPAGDAAWRLKARIIRPGEKPEEKFRRWKGSRISATREGEAWRKTLLRDQPEGADQTVASFVKVYLVEVAEPLLSLSAYRDVEYVLDNYVVPHIGKVRLGDLKPQDIEKCIAAGRGRGLGYHSLKKIRAKLSRLCDVALKRELLLSNPVDRTERPRDDRPEEESRRLTGDVVAQLLAAAEGHWLSLVFRIAVDAGLRRGEICGLQLGDYDRERKTLSVRRKIADVAGVQKVEAPKRRSFRTISIGDDLAELIDTHIREMTPTIQALCGRDPEPTDWLFLGRDGDFLHPNTISHAQTPFFRKLGLPPGYALHTLRHTHASEMLDGGVELATVSRRLGHARISTTVDNYVHPNPENDRAAATKADALRRRPAAGAK